MVTTAHQAVQDFGGLQDTLDLRALKDLRARLGLTALCVALLDLLALLPSTRNPLLLPRQRQQPQRLTNQKNHHHQQLQRLTNQKNRQRRRRHP
jgi:hypothetical protein